MYIVLIIMKMSRSKFKPNASEMCGTLAAKNAYLAFFVHRAERSGVATSGSDFRSIELSAPPAAARTPGMSGFEKLTLFKIYLHALVMQDFLQYCYCCKIALK